MIAFSSAQQARRFLQSPGVYDMAVAGLRIALFLAGAAALYLLFGLFSNQLAAFPWLARPEQERILGNLVRASNALSYSLAAAALLSVFVYWDNKTAGYLMALSGGALYAGIPFLVSLSADPTFFSANRALRQALVAFPRAAPPLFVLGGLLVGLDVIRWLKDLLHNELAGRASASIRNAREFRDRRYALLAPALVGGVVLLCLLCAPLLRQGVVLALKGGESLMAGLVFGAATSGIEVPSGRPLPTFDRSPIAEWILVGDLSLMLVSKSLQVLEWIIYRRKE